MPFRSVFCSLFLIPLLAFPAQRDTLTLVKANRQAAFRHTVPAGNYSGICHLRDNEYLVVSDKSATDGFFVFAIDIDSVTGNIRSVENRGFRSSGLTNRDGEGIAYLPVANSVLISGEADGKILEYYLDGKPTGREAELPAVFATAAANLGLESLSYSAATHRLWTCNESTLEGDGQRADAYNHARNRIRLQSFDDSLRALRQYPYEMDAPIGGKNARWYAMGVSELVALDDASLLVLEREFYVPAAKVGAFVNCKLYQVWPELYNDDSRAARMDAPFFLPKHLVCEWHTSLSLTGRSLANYEGICLGPKLQDGSQVLLLVADSQDQYGGVLKDWFKTLVVK